MVKSIKSIDLLQAKADITNQIKTFLPHNKYLLINQESPIIHTFNGDKEYSEKEWSKMSVITYDEIVLLIDTSESVNSYEMRGNITMHSDGYFTINSPFNSKEGLNVIDNLIDIFLETIEKCTI